MATQLEELVVYADGRDAQQILPSRRNNLFGRSSRSDKLAAKAGPGMERSGLTRSRLHFAKRFQLHPFLQALVEIGCRDDDVTWLRAEYSLERVGTFTWQDIVPPVWHRVLIGLFVGGKLPCIPIDADPGW